MLIGWAAEGDLATCCAQRVIYHLLDEVAQLMAGHAPRIQQQLDLGQAAVLQVFPLKKGSKCVQP